MKTSHLKIEGMSCEGCVASASQALRSVPGVRAVNVDLARGQASVEHGDDVREGDLVSAVADVGYDAEIESEGTAR